jgi:hypothetical protein
LGEVLIMASSEHSSALPVAWPAVILAVDPSERSGVAVFVRGAPKLGDEINSVDANAVRMAVLIALGLAEWEQVPCVLVLRRPARMTAAAQAARERWQAAWCELNGVAGSVLDVEAARYRAPLPGTARTTELAAARVILGPFVGSLGRTEAAAICVGHWATRSRALGSALGKRAEHRNAPQEVVDVG